MVCLPSCSAAMMLLLLLLLHVTVERFIVPAG
jgi:hypothetical protein